VVDELVARDTPLSVALIVIDEASYRPAFTDDLAREVIRVDRLDPDVLAGQEPPAAQVVLTWLPEGFPERSLAEVVSWRERGERPVALLGCAPHGGNADSERALAAGFDDFVAGRMSAREMAGRIRALFRRLRTHLPDRRERLRYGNITVDRNQHQLWVGDEPIRVTPTELAVMGVLVAARGSTRTRGQILDEAWGDQELEVGERAVDNVILRLRRKLGDPDLVITVRGIGFRLAER
jgi:DNA-binding response OmpR family regulator